MCNYDGKLHSQLLQRSQILFEAGSYLLFTPKLPWIRLVKSVSIAITHFKLT